MKNIWKLIAHYGARRHVVTRYCGLLLLLGYMESAHAGIMAERTRLIFDGGARERNMMLANTNDYPIIVQSWVDNGEGNSEPDTIVSAMLVLPAVMRLQPHEVKNVRVIYTGAPLPQERESAFWLNLYEIPVLPADQRDKNDARVMLGINTQMKIFYRPAGMAKPAEGAGASLSFTLRREDGAWALVCHNGSPYFTSFASLAVNHEGRRMPVRQLPDMMVPPMSERSYPFAQAPAGMPEGAGVDYVLINDLGNLEEGHGAIGK